jgi:hypothetical protein
MGRRSSVTMCWCRAVARAPCRGTPPLSSLFAGGWGGGGALCQQPQSAIASPSLPHPPISWCCPILAPLTDPPIAQLQRQLAHQPVEPRGVVRGPPPRRERAPPQRTRARLLAARLAAQGAGGLSGIERTPDGQHHRLASPPRWRRKQPATGQQRPELLRKAAARGARRRHPQRGDAFQGCRRR